LGDNILEKVLAPKMYFGELFDNFYRNNKDENIINSFLSYWYVVLRSGIARAEVSCGLNPVIGVFHSKNKNPLVYYIVKSQYNDFIRERILTPALKNPHIFCCWIIKYVLAYIYAYIYQNNRTNPFSKTVLW